MSLRFQLPLALATLLVLSTPALADPRPEGDVIGSVSQYTVAAGDTLSDIARRNEVGLTELLAANPDVSSTTIHPGLTLTVPGRHLLPAGARTGIIVNLAELRLFHFNADGTVQSAPISVGREGWDTPTGPTKVVEKRKDPTWTVPDSIRAENPKLPKVMPPGPDNPLGQFALNLGWPGYLIHGTNNPSSVGKPSSHGCIRLYPEDIAALFNATLVGEQVTVIDAPITLGQDQGTLYLQVTPTREQATQIVNFSDAKALDDGDEPVKAVKAQLATLKTRGARIDDHAVDTAIARHDGIPVAIGTLPPAPPPQPVAAQSTSPMADSVNNAIKALSDTWRNVFGGN